MRDTKRGIAPLAATYVVFGWFWGCIAVVLANLQEANDLSSGRLGLYLSFTSITGIVTMTIVAPRLEHLARHVTIPVSLALHGMGALLLATLSASLLPVAFLMIGLGTGMVDVLVNAVGYESEVRTSRTGDFLGEKDHVVNLLDSKPTARNSSITSAASPTYRPERSLARGGDGIS